MMSLKMILVLCFVSYGYSAYTHGIAGSFSKVGLVNWRGWGYWSKTNQRWTPLTAPTLTGGTVARSQIAGTSDGGAIIVGGFTSVNGRQAAGVAYYDVAKDDWFPANEVGLYKIAGGPGDTTGNCRAIEGTGVNYLARINNVAVTPLSQGTTLTNPGLAEEAITVPVQVDPLTGRSDVVSANNPVTQRQQVYHTAVGDGRAIIADVANQDQFYVFGNFENVGLDVNLPHNRDFTAAGFVQFSWDPTTKKITPSVIGANGYKSRQKKDTQDTLHPRHCGHSGSNTCHPTNDAMNTFGCNSESPHNTADAVLAGLTRGASGIHFFVQESGRDIYRWTPGSGKWVNVNVNDGQFNALQAGVRAGTGQDIARLAPDATTANAAAQVNVRASSGNLVSGRSTAADPGDFEWMTSLDQTSLWIFRNVYPNVTGFNSPDGYLTGGFQWGWDDAATAKGYFGGLRSTTETASTFVSAFSSGNFPTSKFRAYDAVIPTPPATSPVFPARTSAGFRTKGSVALTSQTALALIDERYPGAPALTFQANRYANTNSLGLKRVADTTSEASDVGTAGAGPRFSTSNRPNPAADDDNGNQKMPWATQYNSITSLFQDAEGTIYARAAPGDDITYDPVLHTAPGHTDNTYGYRFKKSFGSNWMSLTTGGVWETPLGGGLDVDPVDMWHKTVAGDSRLYVFTGGASKAWNFLAQSGVAMYDNSAHKWVDPLGHWRLVSQTANWYDRPAGASTAEVGSKGAANIVHFQRQANGVEIIIAGSFSFIGDAHYPSIVAWDGKTIGAGFRRVGSATTGLYLQQTSSITKRWIEDFAPSDTNPKVGQGSVNCITNNGARMFVGGNFDRSTNAVTSDNYLRNVATISAYDSTTATWQDVDGGCDGTVRQVIVFKGELYAAGDFSVCGQWSNGGNKQSIARISADVTLTSKWHSLATGIQGQVSSLVEWNGELIAAGSFSSVSQSGFGSIASWTGSEWRYLKTSCNDVCISRKLSLAAASVTRNFLGSMLQGSVYSVVATDRLWAVVDSGNIDEAGNTLNNQELAYYDGSGWWRVARAGLETSNNDGYNGMLAVNGSTGEVIIANAYFNAGGMGPWSNGGDGDTINIAPGVTGEPHTFPQYPGIQHANAEIIHFASASLATVSTVALVVALAIVML